MPGPTATSLKLLAPLTEKWCELTPVSSPDVSAEDKKIIESEIEKSKELLRNALLTSLQMQNLVVLAGSGTSLGSVGGPSMQDLWDCAVTQAQNKASVLKKVNYLETKNPNIEELLSRCEAYLQVVEDKEVSEFAGFCRSKILEKCSSFLKKENLEGHGTFLHRLSRRRVRDSRIKLFTTNYDLCFETAAGPLGLVALDGFSFSQPRIYDPRYFSYDIVRRPRTGEDLGNYLEGVFQLYKLHGSVNWARSEDKKTIEIKSNPTAEEACLIYPARGKYQQTYIQPHLELFAQYLASLRESNTCLIVTGFGFNDDHLSEPILSAVKTNPNLRLIIVDHQAEALINKQDNINRYWQEFAELAKQGEDIWFINASFQEFAKLIPDLKSLTPAEHLMKDIKKMVRQ
jgi:hypothetical protein